MAKDKKRPYRKRVRTLTGKKKGKVRYIIYALGGFLLFISLSIFALNYISKNLKRSVSGTRVTQDELHDAISVTDKKLNEIISNAGFVNNEIVDKTVSEKSYKDLNWRFKNVKIITQSADKVQRFSKGLSSLNIDNLEYKIVTDKNDTIYSFGLYGLPTHKLIFVLIPQKIKEKTVIKEITHPNINKPDSKTSFSNINLNKKTFNLRPQKKSKVVIILDDIGINKESVDSLLDISTRLNFAVLPNLPYSEYAAFNASRKGWDVMLHLPMEPNDSSGYTGIDAGEGVLLTGLPKSDILNLLLRNIQSVPHIKGVNNHMGSKFTENAELMELVLKEMKKGDLFFIDSRTTPNTVAFEQARKMGVKTAQRDVFLDENNASEVLIQTRLEELIRISQEKGTAVGIGHPYPNTIKILSKSLPQLESVAEFVSASSVVR